MPCRDLTEMGLGLPDAGRAERIDQTLDLGGAGT
jgi:hypothetical protein